MSSEIAISVKNVSKMYEVYAKPRDRMLQFFLQDRRQLYKEFWALRNIDLEVRRGETIGVLGRNGSGKSTLLQIISGTLSPTSGTITLSGRVVALLELGAGFNPEFTGRENVFLNASIFGLSKSVIEKKFDGIAAFADIGDFIDQPVKTYSSGMYARLAFSVAMSMDPEILIIDETLSVGDVFFQARCMQKLDQFREQGGTVFFVTHDTYAVERICTRAIVLNQGIKIFEGSTADGVTVYYKTNRENINNNDAGPKAAIQNGNLSAINSGNHPIKNVPIFIRRDHVVSDGSAFIEEIFICGEDGVDRSNFTVGEWMIVKLAVKFNQDFTSIDFWVGIRDKSGTLIGGAHSFYEKTTLNAISCGDRRIFSAKIKLDIEPSEYLLVAGVAHHASMQAYQECYGVYDFHAISVSGARKAWGKVVLPSSTSEESEFTYL